MANRWVNRTDAVRTIVRQFRQRATLLRSPDRRHHGRVKAGETLSSNIGRVLDFSAGGIRVLARRKLKSVVDVALWNIHRGLTVQARVIWTKRLGLRRHESGLEFIEVSPDAASGLAALGADNKVHDLTEERAARET